MKVPLPICFLLIVATVVGSWWYRTKEMDFMPSRSVHPTLSSTPPLRDASSFTGPPELVGPPSPVPFSPQDLGESGILPSLEEYQEYTADRVSLRRLFDILTSQEEQLERAYLAGERLLELGTLSLPEKEEIAQKMAALFPRLPWWVYDAEGRQELTLTLRLPANFQADQLLEELSALCLESSGGTVQVNFQRENGPARLSIVPTSPAETTAPRSRDLTDYQSLPAVVATLYELLVSALHGDPTLVLPLWEKPTILQFKVCLTRRAWATLPSL